MENIVLRKMIIPEVDNHVLRDDILTHHPLRESDIYFLIPNFPFIYLFPLTVHSVEYI